MSLLVMLQNKLAKKKITKPNRENNFNSSKINE